MSGKHYKIISITKDIVVCMCIYISGFSMKSFFKNYFVDLEAS